MFNIGDLNLEDKEKWYKALHGKDVKCIFLESEDGWTFSLVRDNGIIYLIDMEIIPEDMQ
jgi:hypothetical protein